LVDRPSEISPAKATGAVLTVLGAGHAKILSLWSLALRAASVAALDRSREAV
jgi:hypothetical protein